MASRADEMTQTAILRAEAYYEERAGWGRFVENYKRMYAQRERERLVRRCVRARPSRICAQSDSSSCGREDYIFHDSSTAKKTRRAK